MNIIRSCSLLFLLLFSTFIFGQTTIAGKVINEISEGIEGANVLLKDATNSNTLAFTATSQNGTFVLTATPGKYVLKITYLGYRTVSQKITVNLEKLVLKPIIIYEDSSELEKVFLKAEAKIVKKGDTTIFNTARFLNGTEQNLNDVLQTLPGIGINNHGKVTVGGKEVDRLLIDGEDLYKKQHQFATQNISSKMVGNIELIRNYKDFETLKTADKTGITALNVKVKDEFKNKLTGTIDAGVGIENKYNLKPSLFNFGKKNKSSLITNFNNIGESPISIQDYIEMTTPVDINRGSSGVTFAKNDNTPRFLTSGDKAKSSVLNFATLSSVFNPNKKIKIDFYGIINHSKLERRFSNEQTLNSNTTPISIFEKKRITEKSLFGIAHLKTIYKRNENSVFVFASNLDTDLSNLKLDIENQTDQNSNFFLEKYKPKKLSSKTNLSYSKKLKNAVFSTNAFFNYDSDCEYLDIYSDQPFLNLNFETDNFQVSQKNKMEQLFSGLDLKYALSNKKFAFYIRSNTSSANERLDSRPNNPSLLDTHLKLNTLKSMIDGNFIYKFNRIYSLGLGASYNYLLRRFNSLSGTTNFLDFNSKFKAEFTNNNIGELSYSFLHQVPTIENLLQNEIVVDHRNLAGNENINFNSLLPYHQFNYQHFIFNPKKKLSLIFNASHKIYEKRIGSTVSNSENLSVTKYKLVNRDKSSSFLVFFEKQLSSLPLAISNSISFDMSKSSYFQDEIQNLFKSQSFGGFVELSSKFKTSPIHFKLGYKFTFDKYSFGAVESRAKREQPYLNLNGNITNNLYWELNNSYNIYKVESSQKRIFNVNPGLRYSEKKSNWEYNITGSNVLNLNTETIIEHRSIPGITEEHVISTLPGYILVGAKYKY